MTTFLELMQQAANEIGIPEPSQIIGSADDTSRQLLALANREGKDFSVMANGNGGWQNLHKEYRFLTEVITVTGNTTSGSPIITGISSTSGITASYFGCNGSGIDVNSVVQSVDSSTQVTLSNPATATATGITLTFGQIAYDLPSDFEYFVNRSFWDGAYKWELVGPISAQEKNILRYGIIASGPRSKFYVRLNKLWLNPMPASEYYIAYDYYSNAWCSSAAGVAQTKWTADTDTYNLDDDCFIQGIKWRYLRAKGFDYGQEKADYDNDCERVMSRDCGARELPLAGGTYGAHFLDESNIPETGYGGV